MPWLMRLTRGLAWGGALWAIYFCADLAGTFAAVHWLFDPTFDAALLLVVAGAVTIAVGALSGALVALVWPRWWPLTRWRKRLAHRRWALAAVIVLVTVPTSYGLRRGRNPEPIPDQPAARPGATPVLWVVIDTLRADSTYGPELSFANAPALGRFAERALTFTDAEATAGWTIPSTAALFTGIHNVVMDASAGRLPAWAPTVAERLSAAGYASHAVIDNVVLETRNGFSAGFATFFQRSGFRFAFSLPAFRLLPDDVTEWLRQNTVTSDYGAEGLTDVALARLAARDERPLFLYVHYMDPHGPYYPHPDLGPPPADGEPMWFWRYRDRLRDGKGPPPSAAQMKLLRHLYDGEIRYADRHLGRLLEAWEQAFGEHSLVMITADHGEEFLEHGNLSHSYTVHRELCHVPLLLRLPAGVLPPARATGPIAPSVSLLDVMPTTLDAIGLPVTLGPRPMFGQSLLPWLRGEQPAPDDPLVSSHSRHRRRMYRYREGPFALMKYMYYDGRPTEAFLFDLATDPTEQHNRIAEQATVRPGITDRFEAVAGALVAAKEASHAPDPESLDEGSLRALGYIQ